MQHQLHTLTDRRLVSHHLRSQHGWNEQTRMAGDRVLPADEVLRTDGGYLIPTSELLATHRELHELDMLDDLVRATR